MSKHSSDSFLPSGAIESPRKVPGRLESMVSPLSHVPRSVPDYISSPHSGNDSPSSNSFMQSRSPSHHPNGPPISPPKTRSTSADDSSAALVEDWRAYTQKLRSQSEGERAHMMADRARVEEVMAEERVLWDRERDLLKARIVELEVELENRKASGGQEPSNPLKQSVRPSYDPISFTSPGSNAVSVTGSIDSSSRGIPQESGRNADGSPFYAPAPRNPSRTFDPTELGDIRVDSMTAPRETAIRVTSKELTSSDFVVSPPSAHSLSPIPETVPESIDISHIQPELEGVAIKATAVSPTFAAKVLSPERSPSKLSPDVKPPGRDVTNMRRSLSSGNSREEKEKKTLEVVFQPENRRLTMHAGHTPNHSITKFAFLADGSESGNATPTQEHHGQQHGQDYRERRSSFAPGHEDTASPLQKEESHMDEQDHSYDQGDKELSGPLGLTNEATKDDAFLAQLTEKLEEARKSSDVSPSTESSSSRDRSLSPRKRLPREEHDGDDDKDDGPPLRLKPSFNFGRPMGRM